MGLLGWGAVALAAGIVWFVLEALDAPVGYEDDTGFHLGADPRLFDELRRLEELRLQELRDRADWVTFG